MYLVLFLIHTNYQSVVFEMLISSKTKHHSKYLDDTQICLPCVAMVLEKQIQNKPMAKGDTSALAILIRG